MIKASSVVLLTFLVVQNSPCQNSSPAVGSGAAPVRLAESFSGENVGSKIIAAIASVPSSGGIVDARNFSGEQVTNATINVSKPITLLLGNWRLVSSANPAILVSSDGVCIKGGGTQGGSGKASIASSTANADTIVWKGSNGCIDNLAITHGGAAAGAALKLLATSTSSVQRNMFSNIVIGGSGSTRPGSVGLSLVANNGSSGLVSYNTFMNVFSSDSENDVSLSTSGSLGPTDNYFYGISVHNYGPQAGVGIEISSGHLNVFFGGYVDNFTTGIAVAPAAAYNQFVGFRTESNATNINDNGTGSMFLNHSADKPAIAGTDKSRTILGTGNFDFRQSIGGGVLTVANGIVSGGSRAPTCDEAHRGVFWYEAGGPGTKDSVQVCAKNAANQFAWRSIY